MAYEDHNHKRHGSVAGAAWIVVAIATAMLVVTAIYRSDHASNTASKKSGAPTSQATGPDAASKNATIGSRSAAR